MIFFKHCNKIEHVKLPINVQKPSNSAAKSGKNQIGNCSKKERIDEILIRASFSFRCVKRLHPAFFASDVFICGRPLGL